jgi:CBS-domain-containing membrane protein
VLAYYFSRENFESAADKTERLIRQLTPEEQLAAVAVTDVMVRSIYSVKDTSRTIAEVLADLERNDLKRLPVLNDAGALKALLYREGLIKYLADFQEPGRSQKTFDGILRAVPKLTHEPAFIKSEATLADARNAMQQISNCKVVFVTQTGATDEPVLGMLTNSDIAKHARI